MIHTFFTHGSGFGAFVVRVDTLRPGQDWEDVPAHCGIILSPDVSPDLGNPLGTVYEMISTGWHTRPATQEDFAWSVEMIGLDEAMARTYAVTSQRNRYCWLTIALIAAARCVPDRWLSCTMQMHKNICSWYVKQYLLTCGWPCPHWLAEQYVPETPNDLWFAVRPQMATSPTHMKASV